MLRVSVLLSLTHDRRTAAAVAGAERTERGAPPPLRAVYADGVRASALQKSKFEMLKAKALAYDIDPAGDYMRPGDNPAEQAFQLLKCGLEMLLRHGGRWLPDA